MGKRFSWLEEAAREEEPPKGAVEAGGEPARLVGTGAAGAEATPYEQGASQSARAVPGLSGPKRRRRNRPKDPRALRNDPDRMTAGARIPRRLRQRVEQALRDPDVTGDEGTNFSLLVESLLERWLEEVGYGTDGR
jgi:hypothetical protein